MNDNQIRIFTNVVRYLICTLFTLLMFAGILQIGLRWEASQLSAQVSVVLAGEPMKAGTLGQDWSGDFTLTNIHGLETAVFSADRIQMLSALPQSQALGVPWRLILTIFIAVAAALVTAYGAMQSTSAWMGTEK